MHGYSLPAQEEALVEFADSHGHKIVKIYRDEGYSARKPAMKRKVMVELLDDIKEGKIDRVLFIKLDRWFRNVREYHKVQAILDENNVTWQAIMEDYNTSTADGRLKVNIMLSVAENEADRTAERVKFVLDSKIRRGEYCYGRFPMGFKKENIDGIDRLVKDPSTEAIVHDFWNHVRNYNSVRLAGMYCNEKYGLQRTYRSWTDLARNELFTGEFKGIKDFCPAYIDREEWEYLMQTHVQIKKTQKPERVYLFTGLLRCPGCGGTLKGTYKTYPNDRTKEYKSYRCNNGHNWKICEYSSCISERKLEKYLLQHIRENLNGYVISAEVGATGVDQKKDHSMEIVALTEQLRRLNVIFMAGSIDDAEYTKMSNDINAKIEKARQAEKDDRPPDLDALKQFLDMDFEEIYGTLEDMERRRLWRSVISEIHFDGHEVKEIKFRA